MSMCVLCIVGVDVEYNGVMESGGELLSSVA